MQLARVTVGELKYDSMKNKILPYVSGATSGAEATPDVKPNDTFYSLHNYRTKKKDQQ